ncbi:DUF1203 domain-containing protein [Ovoidimarina sediminis]|uniref:DUF1203 domain-containing protein n=1 Tax=Ovoidimarina sediminis TaxID=3079856 RepID=UPI002911AAE6|nr:DUF1203 domain-containing protein [Rhodophyticola sp. MJ-SS7]MDU8943146.1 DUF1203 domain-containing protein [Rhodophyticola sp. MJ-SS7]
MNVTFEALPSDVVREIRQTGRDSYGAPVERHVSDGSAYPCRHCLGATPKGETYLILAHRPFSSAHPYAETGPIFLCEADCARAAPSGEVPPILEAPDYIVRGYSAEERIVYGTGGVVPTPRIAARAAEILADPAIAFVDVRSARNNCFQCRVRRAS